MIANKIIIIIRDVDKTALNEGLKTGETLSINTWIFIATQDEVTSKNNYKKCILKEVDIIKNIGRKYRVKWEASQHNTGAGHALTQGDYTHRYKQVANIDHHE